MSLVEQLLMLEKDYYRYNEIALAFGVTTRSVRRWVTEGWIPSITTPAGQHRIPRREMLAASPNYLNRFL